jgi:iron complex outermembrane receptor protein
LIGGVRYTHDSRHFAGENNVAADILFAGRSGNLIFGDSTSFNSVTPRFVAQYDAHWVNVYASYSQGFKAGGFQTVSFGKPIEVKPEEMKSFEIGAKFRTLNGRLSVNLAAFKYNYTNVQVRAYDNLLGITRTTNAASARGKGIEFDAQFRVNKWLDFFAGGSYFKARFTKFPAAVLVGPVFDPVTGAPVRLGNVIVDLAGFPLPHSPKYTAFAGLNIEAPIGDALTGQFSANVRYTDKFDYSAGAGGPLLFDREPSYTVINASGSVGPADGRYRIGFYVNNVANEKYADYRFTQPPRGASWFAAKPRTFGVRVTTSW